MTMDMTSLRAYLKSELPSYDEQEDMSKEQLSNAVLSYFSHKGMVLTPDDEAVIEEYGAAVQDYFNFDENQLAQIDRIENAAQELIDALCDVPDYLQNSFEQSGFKPHPMLIATHVADIIRPTVSCVFFPTRTEDENGTRTISDLYGD